MDNRYHTYGCPELMQDGRFLTNFTPKRTFEQMIRKVNDIESSADAIKAALEMTAEEQTHRMKQMRLEVVRHNIYSWAANLLRTMAAIN